MPGDDLLARGIGVGRGGGGTPTFVCSRSSSVAMGMADIVRGGSWVPYGGVRYASTPGEVGSFFA
jgi:hypothetical protein